MHDTTHPSVTTTDIDARAIAEHLAQHLTAVPALTEMDRLSVIVARMEEAQAQDDQGREVARILAYLTDRFGQATTRGRGRS